MRFYIIECKRCKRNLNLKDVYWHKKKPYCLDCKDKAELNIRYYLHELIDLLFEKNPLQKCVVTFKDTNGEITIKDVMVGTNNKGIIKKGVWCHNSNSIISYKNDYYIKVSELGLSENHPKGRSKKELDRINVDSILKMEFEDVIFEKIQEKNCKYCSDDSVCEICKKVILCEECYHVIYPYKDDPWYQQYVCSKCASNYSKENNE